MPRRREPQAVLGLNWITDSDRRAPQAPSGCAEYEWATRCYLHSAQQPLCTVTLVARVVSEHVPMKSKAGVFTALRPLTRSLKFIERLVLLKLAARLLFGDRLQTDCTYSVLVPAMNHAMYPLHKPPFPAIHSVSVGDTTVEKPAKLTHIPGQAIPIDETGINVREFLHRELSVSRLNDVHEHLWMVGRKGNLHPLHWQKMTKRDILVTEDPGLHLLWYDSTIFIKPLPVCLLDHNFFAAHICQDDALFREACGFLRTYALLIKHESDFRIARELGLLPQGITWIQWSALAFSFANIPSADVNERYHYGELRLHRLNIVHNLYRCSPWYYNIHRDYQSWFSYQLGFMLVLFAYASVVMSSMQVMLTTPLPSWEISALCYWVSAITTLSVVGVLVWQIFTFALAFVFNFISALR
ncbi:hypothetical protein HYDPIDRAFT_27008 [Hydnomerulius pinastri MD-312]|nr:hypothetical protein HYDPIDRAFT_27008 [Hydnomerulius pinastri MD-312]